MNLENKEGGVVVISYENREYNVNAIYKVNSQHPQKNDYNRNQET